MSSWSFSLASIGVKNSSYMSNSHDNALSTWRELLENQLMKSWDCIRRLASSFGISLETISFSMFCLALAKAASALLISAPPLTVESRLVDCFANSYR